MKRIGVFGGAFNPPHIAHKQIINIAKKELNLDYVVVLPSFNPPHKQIEISNKDRKRLIDTAFSNEEGIILDYKEFNSLKLNYTIDTIPYIKEKYKGEIFYIIGEDSLINFHKWKNYIQILKEVNILVLKRGEENSLTDKKILDFQKLTDKKIILLNEKPVDISSSILRFYLSTNIDKYKEKIDDNVYNYIKEKMLYGNYINIINDLKRDLPEKRFYHSLRVVEFALKLNSTTFRIDDKKVILASLLHDVAKPKEIIENFLNNEYDNSDILINKAREKEEFFPILHSLIGPHIVRNRYNILDEDILNAIRYHTTGRQNMSNLEKLIFISDMLEENRNFDGVNELREKTYKDFNEGFKECIKKTYDIVSKKTNNIFYLTKETYNYYK